MFEEIHKALAALREVEGKLDPAALTYGSNGPPATLTADDLARVEEALGQLREARKVAARLVRALDGCNLKDLRQLAAHKRPRKLTAFKLDDCAEELLRKMTGPDGQAGESERRAAHARAVDAWNALVDKSDGKLRDLGRGLARCRERLAGKV